MALHKLYYEGPSGEATFRRACKQPKSEMGLQVLALSPSEVLHQGAAAFPSLFE